MIVLLDGISPCLVHKEHSECSQCPIQLATKCYPGAVFKVRCIVFILLHDINSNAFILNSLVESFEAITTNLADQSNFNTLAVVEESLTLKAERVYN